MMRGIDPDFVEWREEFVSRERGSRVVHYYLEDSTGESHLAVIGTERSLRHMFYAIADEFCQEYGADSCLKWRSRREVIDWLATFLPRRIHSVDHSGTVTSHEVSGRGTYLCKRLNQLGRILRSHNSDIIWTGISWTCCKQLRHYKAFCHNGATITNHSFVLVMSEGENRYLAYLEDMYEDRKGQKKVKVRWFHQCQEFACPIPPPTPHAREVFITPYFQVISAECLDALAVVLTPDHFEKCLANHPNDSSLGIYLCFRQYTKNKFKLFDISTLSGYYDQPVLSCLNILMMSTEIKDNVHGNSVKPCRPKRIRIVKGNQHCQGESRSSRVSGRDGHITACRPLNLNTSFDLHVMSPLLEDHKPCHGLALPIKVDQKVEMLCQDSGIRGCWFRGTVLQLSKKRLKVEYDDVEDEDGCGNLQEWVPTFKPAAPDKLGMRCSGRLTIRPCCPYNTPPDANALKIGTPVDSWWNDGWWEGVVVGVDHPVDDSLQVYFPGEDVFLTCEMKKLRISKDWVGNQWIDVDCKPDILSVISAFSLGAKLSPCSTFSKGAESGCSVMLDREIAPASTNAIDKDKKAAASLRNGSDELLGSMNQSNLGKELSDDNAKDDCDGS